MRAAAQSQNAPRGRTPAQHRLFLAKRFGLFSYDNVLSEDEQRAMVRLTIERLSLAERPLFLGMTHAQIFFAAYGENL